MITGMSTLHLCYIAVIHVHVGESDQRGGGVVRIVGRHLMALLWMSVVYGLPGRCQVGRGVCGFL